MRYLPTAQHNLNLVEARHRLTAVDAFISRMESPKPDRPHTADWTPDDLKHILSMSGRKLYGNLGKPPITNVKAATRLKQHKATLSATETSQNNLSAMTQNMRP